MEVQTFFLCGAIKRNSEAPTNFDAIRVGQHTMESVDGIFPANMRIPCYVLFRRATREGPETYGIRFRIIDEDGALLSGKSDTVGQLEFPIGERFADMAANITFSVPRPGAYRIEIVLASDMSASSLYDYEFEVLPQSP